MLKKLISVAIIISVIAACFCACGKEEEISMVMPVYSDPLCIDPQAVETDEGRIIVANCYEGLVRLDENYKIVPGVAEKWEISPDGLTYTFHLRADAKWQILNSFESFMPDKDNFKETFRDEVTAADFEFGLRRALNPVTKCDEAEKFLCIKNAKAVNDGLADVTALGVEAMDNSTLVISLERANPDFLRLLTLPAAMPCHEEFFNLTRAKYGLELKYTYCNGPYYLSRWAEDNSIVMMKSDLYRGGAAKVDAVYLSVNTDESTYVTRFKQGTYELFYTDDSLLDELKENKNVNYIAVENTVSGLCFNCADSVLQNVNIRKALAMITKFDEIQKPDGASEKANGIVPACCRFGDEAYRKAAGNISNIAYNETQALALWSTGLKEVGTDSLDVKIICTSEYTSQMQKVIQNWQRLLGTSVLAKVETLEKSDFKTALRNGNYQIAVGSVSTDSSTASDMLKKFRSDSNANIFGYKSEEYDKLTDSVIFTAAGSQIIADCRAAEQMIVNDAVFCPLYTYSEYIAVNSEVTGLYPTPAFDSVIFMNGGRK